MVVDMELEDKKKAVLDLVKQKDIIETKLQELKLILDTNHVGMDDALVDSEGYPRSDIDVYQVRYARHEIICLQNDYKSIMKKIEDGLTKIHSVAESNIIETTSNQGSDSMIITDEDTITEPFLKVNLVSPDSPAEQAGIIENDLIIEFGSINYHNFKVLKDVGELVEQSRYKPVVVKVLRSDKKVVMLKLIPRPWNGRGLLGCNVIPLESVER